MVFVDKLVVGVKYIVSVKNPANESFKDYDIIQIVSTDKDTFTVLGLNDGDTNKRYKSLYVGSLEDCKDFAFVMFHIDKPILNAWDDIFFSIDNLKSSNDERLTTLGYKLEDLFKYIKPNDCEYEVSVILRDFYEEFSLYKPNEDDDSFENLLKKYSDLILLQANAKYGMIRPSKTFKDEVESGFFTDYDGVGNFLDSDGKPGPDIRLDNLEEKNWEKYPYVAWYNK